jgi:hypothetical protein
MPGPRISGSDDPLAAALRAWQAIEATTIERAADAIARTRSPLVELMMEIIRQDCLMHRRVRQVLMEQFDRLTAEERVEVQDLLETELGDRMREHCRLFVRTHLLAELAEDHSHAVI